MLNKSTHSYYIHANPPKPDSAQRQGSSSCSFCCLAVHLHLLEVTVCKTVTNALCFQDLVFLLCWSAYLVNTYELLPHTQHRLDTMDSKIDTTWPQGT